MSEPAAAEDQTAVEPPRRGRPRVHVDDAARSRDYRARKRAGRTANDQRVERLVEQLAAARSERNLALVRVAELEELVAAQADELGRLRQAEGGGAGR